MDLSTNIAAAREVVWALDAYVKALADRYEHLAGPLRTTRTVIQSDWLRRHPTRDAHTPLFTRLVRLKRIEHKRNSLLLELVVCTPTSSASADPFRTVQDLMQNPGRFKLCERRRYPAGGVAGYSISWFCWLF